MAAGGAPPSIPSFDAGAPLSDVAAALEREGCVIMSGFADEAARAPLMAELEGILSETAVAREGGRKEFYPGHTKRATGLIARAPAVRDFVTDPRLLGMCDAALLPSCPGVGGTENDPGWKRYQFHVGPIALVIGPGARKQALHREEDPFTFFPVPRPTLILASMLALSDFTEENGATLVVPGSHQWPADRRARPEEILPAAMPAGSLFFWLGGTLHAAGANRTADVWRKGLITTFSAGWLRQEENQYLATPPEVARTLSPKLRALCGYHIHNHTLGFVGSPTASLLTDAPASKL